MEVHLTLNTNMPQPQPAPISANYLRGVALSILITAGFAAFWSLNGSIAFLGATRVALILLTVLITILLLGSAFGFLRAARGASANDTGTINPFRTRAYGLAVAAEFIAIPIVSRVLTLTGYSDAIISTIAVIVGLHFFGLIGAFQSRRFAVVGSAMVFLGLLSLFLPPSVVVGASENVVALRTAVVGWGCALILWTGILPLVRATHRQLRNSPT